jgi:2',3'-cyclic-nucleotide 2'-phosphodiesterase (5'-nucleotidase family)
VNNGDHTEGSGLSDATIYTVGVHGSEVFPIVSDMPFDALTIGNHEMYDNSTVEFMVASGFVSGWGGRYLTSSVLNATTGEHFGSSHVILEGAHSGVKILVFGFLYHQRDACAAVTSQDPAEVLLIYPANLLLRRI